jgi:hypothetical protein
MGAWNCFSIENYLSVGLISRPFVPHTVTVNSERRMDTFEDHNRTYKNNRVRRRSVLLQVMRMIFHTQSL